MCCKRERHARIRRRGIGRYAAEYLYCGASRDDGDWGVLTTKAQMNHRNPSRHRIEEHDMLNWVKQQRIDGNQP